MFGAMSSCVVVVSLIPSFCTHFFLSLLCTHVTRAQPKSVIKIYRNFTRKNMSMRSCSVQVILLLVLHLLIQHSRLNTGVAPQGFDLHCEEKCHSQHTWIMSYSGFRFLETVPQSVPPRVLPVVGLPPVNVKFTHSLPATNFQRKKRNEQ